MSGLEIEIDNIRHSDNLIEENNDNNQNERKINDNITTKSILLYKNGDKFFPPKRFVVNKKYIRTWDSFLEELTKSIQPRSGAIRDIRTPFHGSRIRSLDDLMINGKYVAIPTGETLKLIDYATVIDVSSPASQTKLESRRLKPLKPVNHDTDKTEKRINSQLYQKGIIIFVYRNGDPFTRAIKIVLNQIEQKHMSILVRAIEERVLLPSNKPIRRLYTMDGEIIRFAKDIENGQYYVAASNELFENIKYGQYLPVLRAGKTPQKLNDNKINDIHKSKTSKIQKKDGSNVKNSRELAALKIQAAFRAYSNRKIILQAQENNVSIPKTLNLYKPVTIKSDPVNEPSTTRTLKRSVNGNHVHKKNNSDSPKLINYSKERDSTHNSRKKITNNKETKLENTQESSHLDKSLEKESRKEDDLETFRIAASKIQSAFRGYIVRRELLKSIVHLENQNKESEIKEEIIENVPKNDTENTKIENYVSNDIVKNQNTNDVTESDAAYVEENIKHIGNQRREASARIIQAGYRGYVRRKEIVSTEKNKNDIEQNNQQDDNQQRERAAMTIQAGYRGHKTRESIVDHEEAAKVIQYAYKGYKERKRMNDRKNNAAIVIQAGYRGYKIRRTLCENAEAHVHEKMLVDQAMARNNAASTIQAAFRGLAKRQAIRQ